MILIGRDIGGYIVLYENDHHRLIYLNTCFPVDETIWVGLGDVALLKEMCHRDGLLGLKSHTCQGRQDLEGTVLQGSQPKQSQNGMGLF